MSIPILSKYLCNLAISSTGNPETGSTVLKIPPPCRLVLPMLHLEAPAASSRVFIASLKVSSVNVALLRASYSARALSRVRCRSSRILGHVAIASRLSLVEGFDFGFLLTESPFH